MKVDGADRISSNGGMERGATEASSTEFSFAMSGATKTLSTGGNQADGEMSRQDFKKGLDEAMGGKAPGGLANKLFNAFDADKSQGLSTQEQTNAQELLEGVSEFLGAGMNQAKDTDQAKDERGADRSGGCEAAGKGSGGKAGGGEKAGSGEKAGGGGKTDEGGSIEQIVKMLIEALDKNKDGKLTADEVTPEALQQAFAALQGGAQQQGFQPPGANNDVDSVLSNLKTAAA